MHVSIVWKHHPHICKGIHPHIHCKWYWIHHAHELYWVLKSSHAIVKIATIIELLRPMLPVSLPFFCQSARAASQVVNINNNPLLYHRELTLYAILKCTQKNATRKPPIQVIIGKRAQKHNAWLTPCTLYGYPTAFNLTREYFKPIIMAVGFQG